MEPKKGALIMHTPPRWAVACAWLVPVTILPSAIWRLSYLFRFDGPLDALFGHGGWYLALLSAGSVALGLLTVGLVRPWGEIYPKWIPVLGGEPVPAKSVATAAFTGGGIITALVIYATIGVLFDPPVHPTPLIGADEPAEPQPGIDVLRWYLPLVLWPPLLIAVAADYRRRHTPIRARD